MAKRDYLLVIDYFSKFPFVFELHDKTASSVITALKSLYSIHDVPLTLFAHNIPFASQQMQNFAVTWGFEIVTSSPNFPRSNGQAERSIQTVKTLFKKAEESQSDPQCSTTEPRRSPTLTKAQRSFSSIDVCEPSFQFRPASSCRHS